MSCGCFTLSMSFSHSRFFRDNCVRSILLVGFPAGLHPVRLPLEHVPVLGPVLRERGQHEAPQPPERHDAAVGEC